jgi:hypothetical protein
MHDGVQLPMSRVAPAFGKLEETEVMFTTGSQPRQYVYGYTVPAGDLRLVFPDFKARYRLTRFGVGKLP